MSLKNNPTLKSSAIRAGITIGDPSGIGPAIVLKALETLKGKADFTVIGNRLVLNKAAKILKIRPLSAKLIDLNNVNPEHFAFGRINARNGRACLEYLDAALDLLKENKIDCLVTCPISKKAVNLAGAKFSGHTEYLAAKTGRRDLVMLLLNAKLKFSLVTRHVPLKEVCGLLSRKVLRNNILKTIAGLGSLFLIKNPRLVVCGVNPHASDNGVIGREEQRVIIPVIKSLKEKIKGASLTGPLSADAAILQAAKGNFDCVIAAYHDQALIPLKLTDFNSGVNFTLGLPFVRASPLHGTAFDIAKRPALADPGSLIAAIKLALKCASNQKKA